MSANPPTDTAIWKKLEPYAQLVTSLLPRADSLSVFDAEGWLRWTSESTSGPDLPNAIRELLPAIRDNPAEAGRMLRLEGEDYPHYIWWLRNDEGAFIAVVAISTRRAVEADQATFGFVNAMVKPAMECLRRELSTAGSAAQPA